MGKGDLIKPVCPVGESECQYIDELMRLRARTEELSELVHTDTLTGLYNYRHFSLVLEQELERTRRTGQPTCLIMVDLDHFKAVNDTWGHEIGNKVLKQTANLMTQLLRRIDIPCRYGGEEFALILPGTPLPRAIQAAERLRMALQETAVEFDGQQLSVTASMGVSVYMKESKLSVEAFIKEADGFLYQAKEAGRNRIAHPDLETVRPKGQVSKDEKAALFGSE